METEDKLINDAIILITCGIFFFPMYIRLGLIQHIFSVSNFAWCNVLPLLGCALILFLQINSRDRKINKFVLFCTVIMLILAMVSQITANNTSTSIAQVLVNFFVPMVLLVMDKRDYTLLIFQKCRNIMNISVVIMFSCYVIDRMFDGITGKFLTTFVENSYILMWANNIEGRYISYFGHFLYSAEIFLIFYSINSAYYYYVKKKDAPIWYAVISLIGILFTGSRSAAAIFIVTYLILNMKKPNYIIAGTVLVSASYLLGLFDVVISRAHSIGLTGGRIETWLYMQQFDFNYAPFFIGHGTEVLSALRGMYAGATAGFEFIFLLSPLEFGVLCTIFLYAVIFVQPIFEIIKLKKYYLFICFSSVALFVNTYNGLCMYLDHMYMYCWFIFMILSLAFYDSNKQGPEGAEEK